MNLLAAALILVLEEEDAFWCFVNIVENMLPPNYFTSNLLVSQADQRCVHRAHKRVDKNVYSPSHTYNCAARVALAAC